MVAFSNYEKFCSALCFTIEVALCRQMVAQLVWYYGINETAYQSCQFAHMLPIKAKTKYNTRFMCILGNVEVLLYTTTY